MLLVHFERDFGDLRVPVPALRAGTGGPASPSAMPTCSLREQDAGPKSRADQVNTSPK